ncbi:5-dehydro-4-deoxyglucarate dehydratase [Amnibacterium setariae]|uniref:Probable 5-dehydro-4-deoxyglucarate dehydratase n=1 Tax=Amnibacterium setariae TaxID=2306585 RepID=A0A3A1TZD3_9MICO|nr:5-dehydro-4-deoxyglucarate dehydratase [Amnibacterium setariae]RIX28968.1 5-dehydro-4-deoxyglucarate dehydratase [Amnibacterium setariae]
MRFDGVLFFPVTPFGDDGEVAPAVLREHVAAGVAHGAGGVFAGCGTGEFHALTLEECVAVTRIAVEAAGGAVPVVTGVGGSVTQAARLAARAADEGADAVLLLPPSLVTGPASGLERYVEAVAGASPLPVVVYNRGTALYPPALMRRLAADPRIIGFKDGAGDVARVQEIVAVVREVRDDFAFFNGLLTAEASQAAYRGIGVPLYSSAAFAMAPEIATAYYDAYVAEDEERRLRVLREFYLPLVALRDETPGFGVSLVKAGLRLQGVPVGAVRPPLVDPDPRQEEQLAQILARGRELAAELA